MSQPHCQQLRKQFRQIRQIKSKGAILVIVWTYLIISHVNFIYESTTPSTKTLSQGAAIACCIIALLSPFAGFIAGVYFGTYKVMRIGLWLMWIGGAVTVLTFTLQSLLVELTKILEFVSVLIAVLLVIVGFVAFSVNSVPFGLDQMLDGSEKQITAFIHWFIWSVFAGVATSELGKFLTRCIQLDPQNTCTIFSFVSAVLISLALCCNFLFHRRLIIEPESNNPVKTVFKVLKFVAKHKHPVRRSAFTYCEDEKPSRMDLAKTKYGGPFTTEQVEDIKTCLRMTLVITSVGIIVIPAIAYKLSIHDSILSEFRRTSSVSECCDSLIELGNSLAPWGTLYLPVYEVVVYPMIKKWIPTTLKRIGIALILSATSSIILLTTSIIWYELSDSGECMFSADYYSPLPVDRNWIEVPISIVLTISAVSMATGILEFVCAQSPYNLRGLLIGMVYSVILSSVPLGAGIYAIWKMRYQEEGGKNPNCNIWFYLFTTVATTLAFALWCAVAKWYKKRERDEPDRQGIFVENYYDYYCTLGSP